MRPDEPILVAGAGTVAGRALTATLAARGLGPVADDRGVDATDAAAVAALFAAVRPAWVVYAGAREAGIEGNLAAPADLLVHNLLAQILCLREAQRHGVRGLLYLASSCCYPRDCPQPMRPEHLGSGPLEPSSEAYATARLAGLALVRALRRQHGAPFAAAIPANVFGPGDDLSPTGAHAVAALMRRCWDAARRGDPEVVVWGGGRARREWLYAPDLADAAIFLLARPPGDDPINVGSGWACTVAELAERIRELAGYRGRLRFDPTRPEGAPLKTLDCGPLRALGWRPPTRPDDALAATWAWVRGELEQDADQISTKR